MFDNITFTKTRTTMPLTSRMVSEQTYKKPDYSGEENRENLSNSEFVLSGGVDAFRRPPITDYALENLFYLQATSAESNVLNVASSLGNECLVLTKFVKGSPIAQFIKNDLRSRNINFEGAEVDQGGPWGYRHQFNIADSGFGLRAPRVWNDRAGEVGRTMTIEEFATYINSLVDAEIRANKME